MHSPKEYSIDLTAQELMDAPVLDEMTEIEDLAALDFLEVTVEVANADQAPTVSFNAEDSIEIELSAQEIDTLLSSLPKA